MIIARNNSELAEALKYYHQTEKSIGFTPTMGALHQGHISLIEQSKHDCDITVCSIFVNPTQFNDIKDLEKYPRTEEADTALLTKSNCDILYLPSVTDIYPNDWQRPIFDFGELDKVMEGAHRPGHFKGMSEVVHRLLSLVKPTKLYMGQKDFQQLTIVKRMLEILNWTNIELVSCPIVREMDGLAMSSRNVRLNGSQRASARAISKVLMQLNKNVFASAKDYCQWATYQLNLQEFVTTEYIEIVDINTLQPIADWQSQPQLVCCIAAKVGDVRLIDNRLF
jgi:pantoate--beta-alanine ligase